MKRIIDLLKDIFYAFFFGVIGSLVLGIAAALAVASFIQTPIYTLLVTAFFVPFNFTDMKNAIAERQWLAFAGRAISLLAISGFIFGLIRFSSGYGYFAPYIGWVLIVLVPILFITITTYGLCAVILPKDSDFHPTLDRIAERFKVALNLRF